MQGWYPANKWQFEIVGPINNWTRQLARMSSLVDDVSIREIPEGEFESWFGFSSRHLDHLTDPHEIYQKTYKFKMLIDGVSYLVHENKNSYIPIRLGDLYDEDDNKISYKKDIENKVFDFSYSTAQKNEYYKRNIISHLIHIVSKDEFIKNLLLMCSEGMEYGSLYNILDEIKTFLKGKTKLEKLGINSTQLNRFTHTANNFSSLGIIARHGNLSHDAPTDPMPPKEAQKFITEIIKIVLEKYYHIELLLEPYHDFENEIMVIDKDLDF